MFSFFTPLFNFRNFGVTTYSNNLALIEKRWKDSSSQGIVSGTYRERIKKGTIFTPLYLKNG